MQYFSVLSVYGLRNQVMEELELSIKCKEGDTVARKILYERYSRQLYGICLRYSADKGEAMDLLHDTFIKIYAGIGKFTYRGSGSLGGWLAKVAVNMALERIRTQSKYRTTDIMQDIPQEEPAEGVMESIPAKVLLQFIEELPPGYRAVFNLYVFEELPHKEIAGLLRINEKSSSSQLLRAKAAIAKKINNYLKGTENGKQQQ